MAEIAERLGARVTRVEAEWGAVIAPERIEAALESRGASVVEVQPDPCAGVYFESERFAATC